jgi:hypothetical protein
MNTRASNTRSYIASVSDGLVQLTMPFQFVKYKYLKYDANITSTYTCSTTSLSGGFVEEGNNYVRV